VGIPFLIFVYSFEVVYWCQGPFRLQRDCAANDLLRQRLELGFVSWRLHSVAVQWKSRFQPGVFTHDLYFTKWPDL